jgi:hypothetical protein
MLFEGNDSDRLTVEMIVAEIVFFDTKRKVNKIKCVE